MTRYMAGCNVTPHLVHWDDAGPSDGPASGAQARAGALQGDLVLVHLSHPNNQLLPVSSHDLDFNYNPARVCQEGCPVCPTSYNHGRRLCLAQVDPLRVHSRLNGARAPH